MLAVIASLALHVSGSVSLSLDVASGALAGRFESEVPEGAMLVSYLAALNEPYRGNDIDRTWDYPRTPESSSFHWDEVAVDGVVLAMDSAAMRIPIRGKHVVAKWHATVPRRYGPLGRVDDDYLLTSVSPFLVKDASALPVRWTVSVSASGSGRWLDERKQHWGDPTEFFLAWGKHGFETLPSDQARSPLIRARKPVRRFGKGGELPVHAENDPGADDASARSLLEMRTWIQSVVEPYHIALQPWVLGAMRREMASCAGDRVVISQELFHNGPFDAVSAYYRFALARTVVGCAIKRAFQVDAEDADALSTALIKQQHALAKQELGFFGKLLQPLIAIPDVDDLIYAPKMLESAMFFASIDESFSRPPEHDRFFHRRPKGKLFYEKMLDRLGWHATVAFFQRAMLEKKGPKAVGERLYPEDTRTVLRHFSSDYPEYDLDFSAEGRKLEVTKSGTGAAAVEPFDVDVTLKNGTKERRRLSGAHDKETTSFDDDIETVVLDPKKRIVQKRVTDPGRHPRFNDTTKHGISISATRLSAAFATAGGEMTTGIDFSLRRENDYHNLFGIGLYYVPASLGGLVRYGYQFGQRVNADVLRYRISSSLALDRLNGSFAGQNGDIFMGSVKTLFEYDDRIVGRLATHGFGANVHADLGLPFLRGAFRPYAALGAGVLGVVSLAYGHVLNLRVRADVSFGEVPVQAQYTVGGRNYERSRPQQQRLAPQRGIASVEYRHELVRGPRTRVMDLFLLDGLEGAVFADAAVLGDTFRTWFAPQNQYYDVGYSLYFLLEQLGFNPGVFAVDFGVQLNQHTPSRLPFNVNVSFTQSFSQF